MVSEAEKQENQRKIIEWINDDFSLTLSGDRVFENAIEIEQINSGSDYIVSFQNIFEVIKDYIRSHPNEFSLDELVHSNVTDEERRGVVKRPWWSPFVPRRETGKIESCRSLHAANESLGFGGPDGSSPGDTRKIQHNSMNFIHPGALTEEQYEELKILIPNACKVKGCSNNWNFGPDSSKFSNLLGKIYGKDGEVTGKNVRNGICDFHRVYNSDGSRNTSYSADHTDSKPDHATSGEVIKNINAETLKNLELSIGYEETELDYINFNSDEIRRVAWKAKILDDEIFPVASQIKFLKEIRSSDIGKERENKKAHNDEQLELRKKFVELMKKLSGEEPTTGGNKPSFPPINTQNQVLKELRVTVIAEISQFLNKEPKVTDQELEENSRGWKTLIENSNNSKQINDLRDRVLADIRGKRREKVNSNKLSELVKSGQKTENYEELKKIVEQVEKFRGEENYKLLESEINTIKRKLAQKNPNKYRDDNVKMIEKEMKTKGVEKDELDPVVKKELEKLENGEITDLAEIDASKNKISNNIVKKSVENKLASYLKEYQKAPDETAKKIAKKKLLDFISNKNHFYESAYQNKKREVDKILGIISTQPNSSENNSPLVPVMIIGSFFAFLICLVIIIRKRRILKRKNKL